MRQFIREHPWRLEIVPLGIILITLAVPVLFGRQVAADSGPMTSGRWLNYLGLPFYAIVLWLYEFQLNHDWVRAERVEKRFSRSVAWAGAAIAVMVTLSAVELLSHRLSLCILVVVSSALVWLIQNHLERTRRFVPKTAEAEADKDVAMAPIKPGDTIYYREMQTKWRWLAPYILLTVWAAVNVWFLSHSLVFGALAVVVMGTMAIAAMRQWRASFVITNQRLTAEAGRRFTSIPLQNIVSCDMIELPPCKHFERGHYRSGGTYDGMLLYALPSKAGPSIRVVRTSGHVYVLGFDKPHIACALINAAIAARENKEKI